MAELIVVGFKKDMYRASEVLNTLQEMNQSWVVDLNDAVAVYRDYNGKLRVDQSYQATTGEGAAWGGLFGMVMGSLLAAPFTAGASSALAAGAIAAGAVGGGALGATGGAIDADISKEDYGISEDFVHEVSGMLQPGDSAIFALVRSADAQYLESHFRGWGGKILRSTLSETQSEQLEKVLNPTPA